jgi:TetR/AcrR family transcriptional repressor of lmrAB and yxaGH operons
MPPQSDARIRMIQSAALLFRERGVEGTAFSDVLEHSGAPRGSVYHHFPGGKLELAEEATRYAGDFIAAALAAALEHDHPIAALGKFIDVWIAILRESDYEAGCPIVAATLEGKRAPGARQAAATAFASWEQLVADALSRHEISPARARSLATLIIASIEGAVVLARAQQTTEPLERVAHELRALAEIVLAGYGGLRQAGRPKP